MKLEKESPYFHMSEALKIKKRIYLATLLKVKMKNQLLLLKFLNQKKKKIASKKVKYLV